jgi:hypothetical protein
MRNKCPSPIDATPRASLYRTIMVVITGFALAFALNPGSLGRWDYMLNDSAAVRPVQVVADAVSDATAATWRSAGLQVPYDVLRDLAHRARLMVGASN